jgi:hypothetical protein
LAQRATVTRLAGANLTGEGRHEGDGGAAPRRMGEVWSEVGARLLRCREEDDRQRCGAELRLRRRRSAVPGRRRGAGADEGLGRRSADAEKSMAWGLVRAFVHLNTPCTSCLQSDLVNGNRIAPTRASAPVSLQIYHACNRRAV